MHFYPHHSLLVLHYCCLYTYLVNLDFISCHFWHQYFCLNKWFDYLKETDNCLGFIYGQIRSTKLFATDQGLLLWSESQTDGSRTVWRILQTKWQELCKITSSNITFTFMLYMLLSISMLLSKYDQLDSLLVSMQKF